MGEKYSSSLSACADFPRVDGHSSGPLYLWGLADSNYTPFAPCRDVAWNWSFAIGIVEMNECCFRQVDKLCPEPKDLSNWCFVQMGNSSLAFQQIVDFYRKAQVHFEGKEEKKISPLLKNSDFACEDWGAQGLLKPSCLTWFSVIRKRWSKTLFQCCDHFEKSA